LPMVTRGKLRDSAVVSRRIFRKILQNESLPNNIRGQVLRLPAARGSREPQLQSLDSLLGLNVRCNPDNGGFMGMNAQSNSGEMECFAPFKEQTKPKPVIFVFPIFLAVGGVERNTIEIMQRLNDRFEFIVVTMERLRTEQGSLAAAAADAAHRVVEMAEAVTQVQYLGVLRWMKLNFKPDLVWICNGSPWLCDHAEKLRNLFADIPIVDQMVYDTDEGWINRYAEKGIQSFDRFIAINKRIERVFVERLRIDRAKIDLIYPVLNERRVEQAIRNIESPKQIREKFELPVSKQIFLFNGRLTKQKQPLEFLTLARARQNNQDEHFLLIGDGELSHDVSSFIEKHSLNNVTRIPFTDRVFELLKASDGMVITSLYEGLPIAMLEALCMKVPVLATNVGDIQAVLEEYGCGEIIPRCVGEKSLENAFVQWKTRLAQYQNVLAERASHICNRFSAQTAAKQYEACWKRAMKSKNKSKRCL
jgi:glycosyltransferase involved in cell wall biosynthesis